LFIQHSAHELTGALTITSDLTGDLTGDLDLYSLRSTQLFVRLSLFVDRESQLNSLLQLSAEQHKTA
jgi:hypothetical protein